MKPSFSERILKWFERYGRKTLPWQCDVSPYKVWVSEVMLQQTRVETVIPYFDRFLQRYPTVEALASAPIDEVLHLWSGLGYYARARNLHKAAQWVVERYGGEFPKSLQLLGELPGVGRSTAGAIYSLGMQQRAAILDGNIKRVLARHAGIEGWTGSARIAKQLWVLAEEKTPAQEYAAYNQAMMDLGAMICTRTRPKCDDCPVVEDCIACIQKIQHQLPTPKPRKSMPVKQVTMLIIVNMDNEVLMKKRAAQGVWGGLWGFPEFETITHAHEWFAARFNNTKLVSSTMERLTHTFTHFQLQIEPVLIRFSHPVDWVMEDDQWLWYNRCSTKVGLASPVSKLIRCIESVEEKKR